MNLRTTLLILLIAGLIWDSVGSEKPFFADIAIPTRGHSAGSVWTVTQGGEYDFVLIFPAKLSYKTTGTENEDEHGDCRLILKLTGSSGFASEREILSVGRLNSQMVSFERDSGRIIYFTGLRSIFLSPGVYKAELRCEETCATAVNHGAMGSLRLHNNDPTAAYLSKVVRHDAPKAIIWLSFIGLLIQHFYTKNRSVTENINAIGSSRLTVIASVSRSVAYICILGGLCANLVFPREDALPEFPVPASGMASYGTVQIEVYGSYHLRFAVPRESASENRETFPLSCDYVLKLSNPLGLHGSRLLKIDSAELDGASIANNLEYYRSTNFVQLNTGQYDTELLCQTSFAPLLERGGTASLQRDIKPVFGETILRAIANNIPRNLLWIGAAVLVISEVRWKRSKSD